MLKWWKNWAEATSGASKPCKRGQHAACRRRQTSCPRLEPLEERSLPTTIIDFNIPTPHSCPASIAAGPDGNLWFTEQSANQIGRITTDGIFKEFPVPTPNSHLEHITAGPD